LQVKPVLYVMVLRRNFGHISRRCLRFYTKSPSKVLGEELSRAIDIGTIKVGETVDVPYEITVSDAWRTLWQSCFYQHDRLYTSNEFAKKLDFSGQPLPFNLLLFKTVSMSHIDDTREVLDLGFDNAVYVRPAYEKETFRKTFIVKRLRTTSDGRNTVATIRCELLNTNNELVFTADKTMLFYGLTNPNNRSVIPRSPEVPKRSPYSPTLADSKFLNKIVNNVSNLPVHKHLALLSPEQLIIHGFARPLGKSLARSLTSLVRMTHPMLYDTNRFTDEEIVVSGGLVLALTTASASVKLYEILYEQLEHAVFTNRVSSVDAISALTYIDSITPIQDTGLEEIKATTIGIKNVNVLEKLTKLPLPLDLFNQKLRPSEVEEIVAEHCSVLQGKIVNISHRRLVRQSPYSQDASIPLL